MATVADHAAKILCCVAKVIDPLTVRMRQCQVFKRHFDVNALHAEDRLRIADAKLCILALADKADRRHAGKA